MKIEVPELDGLGGLFDHKDGECVGYVWDEEGNLHFAVQLGEAIVAVEHIPVNYPATHLAFYPSRQRWIEAIREVGWIVKGLRNPSQRCAPDCPEELKEGR